jgi:hypothetical protein
LGSGAGRGQRPGNACYKGVGHGVRRRRGTGGMVPLDQDKVRD